MPFVATPTAPCPLVASPRTAWPDACVVAPRTPNVPSPRTPIPLAPDATPRTPCFSPSPRTPVPPLPVLVPDTPGRVSPRRVGAGSQPAAADRIQLGTVYAVAKSQVTHRPWTELCGSTGSTHDSSAGYALPPVPRTRSDDVVT